MTGTTISRLSRQPGGVLVLGTVTWVTDGDSDREVLAEWDQQLRLVASGGSEGAGRFVVEILDDRGAPIGAAEYGHDDFPSAAADYRVRQVDALAPKVRSGLRVVEQLVVALASSDVEASAALFHDDFVHVDHRPVGHPTMSKQELLRAQRDVSDMPLVWVPQTLEVVGPAGGVSTGDYWTLNFERWTPLEHGVHLAVVEDGQLLRYEIYPDGQRDAAVARFAELTGS